jgi:hypothetical protein
VSEPAETSGDFDPKALIKQRFGAYGTMAAFKNPRKWRK